MAITQDVVRRLTVIANETGLTTLKQKLDDVDRAQDRVAVSSTKMGRATDEAQRRIAQIAGSAGSVGAGLLGGFAGRAGAEALAMVGRLAPAAITAYAAFKLLNATIEEGVSLLQKYGVEGRRELFKSGGKGIDEQLAELTRFQNDTATLAQQKYAGELSLRLDEANYKIKEFLKVSLDLTDPALKLMSAWVTIVEQIAKAVQLVAKAVQLVSQFPGAGALSAGANAVISSIPGVGQAYNLVRGANALLPGTPAAEPETMEQARQRGLDMLRGGLGGGFHGRFIGVLDKPQKEETKRADDYDRAIKSITRQTEALEIQATTFGQTTEQAAKFRIEQELLNAAQMAGRDVTDAMKTQISELADRYGKATVELERMREAQRFMTEINYSFRDAFSGFAQDLKNGATFADAFTNALTRLSDRLLDMAINQLWQAAFPTPGKTGLFSSSGGGGLFGALFGGGGQFAGPVGQTAVVGPLPVAHGGGIIGQIPGSRYIHPAYFDNAPRYHSGGMAGLAPDEVPAILQKGERVIPRGGSAAPVYQDNRSFIIDARGATPDAVRLLNAKIDKLRSDVPQMSVSAVSGARVTHPDRVR